MSDKGKWVLTTSEIAEIFKLSERRIQQLTKEGLISRLDRGKYHLPTVVEEYSNLRISEGNQTLYSDDGDEIDGDLENALLTRAKRHKAELELQIMRGELHRSIDIERVMNDMLSAFRARCLALPTKLAPRLIGQTEIAVIQRIIKNEANEALNELADYDPEVFYAQSKDTIVLEGEDDGA